MLSYIVIDELEKTNQFTEMRKDIDETEHSIEVFNELHFACRHHFHGLIGRFHMQMHLPYIYNAFKEYVRCIIVLIKKFPA